jgi:hypothetical protein
MLYQLVVHRHRAGIQDIELTVKSGEKKKWIDLPDRSSQGAQAWSSQQKQQ